MFTQMYLTSNTLSRPGPFQALGLSLNEPVVKVVALFIHPHPDPYLASVHFNRYRQSVLASVG